MSQKLFCAAPGRGLSHRHQVGGPVGIWHQHRPVSAGPSAADELSDPDFDDHPAANTFPLSGRTEDGIPPIVFPRSRQRHHRDSADVTLRTLDKVFKRGYVESFNFTLQRELKFGFVGQAAYVGPGESASRRTRS